MKYVIGHIHKNAAALAKFFTSSVLATAVDYALFFLLNWTVFGPVLAHAVSYPIAVVVNFYLQKRFIFNQKRSTRAAFMISMFFSLLGWGIGVALMIVLMKIPALATIPVLAKIAVTGVLFFFNFYTKRYAFEGRVPGD